MEAFTILGAVKVLIDFFEENYTGVATGILLSNILGSELITLGDSVYYLFDSNGNKIGTKDISQLSFVPIDSINLKNEKEIKIAFEIIDRKIGFQSNDTEIGFK